MDSEESNAQTWQRMASGIFRNDQEKIEFSVAAGRRGEDSVKNLIYNLIDDDSEDVRYYALRALVLDAIDRTATARDVCWRLIDHDQSSRVRGLAAACIGSLYSASKDRMVFAKLQGRIAKAADRFEAESMVEALYSIAGRPPVEWPNVRTILAGQIDADPPEVATLVKEAAGLERFLAPSDQELTHGD
jgi:hypothetical protein